MKFKKKTVKNKNKKKTAKKANKKPKVTLRTTDLTYNGSIYKYEVKQNEEAPWGPLEVCYGGSANTGEPSSVPKRPSFLEKTEHSVPPAPLDKPTLLDKIINFFKGK